MTPPIERLEEKLGYQFKNRELLFRALTHRSCAAEFPPDQCPDNEQLEFLGDSVLGFVVSEALVAKFPAAREGDLSQWKSHLVSAAYLHHCALAVELGDFLRLGKGEEKSGGRTRKTVLANAFEALIAAIHLDGGIDVAKNFVTSCVLSGVQVDDGAIELLNHKSVLQERTQAMGLPMPRYSTVGTAGPEHAKVFTVEARVGDTLSERATGSSKKAASQHAAQMLIGRLKILADKNVANPLSGD
jgi:ribonuclease III